MSLKENGEQNPLDRLQLSLAGVLHRGSHGGASPLKVRRPGQRPEGSGTSHPQKRAGGGQAGRGQDAPCQAEAAARGGAGAAAPPHPGPSLRPQPQAAPSGRHARAWQGCGQTALPPSARPGGGGAPCARDALRAAPALLPRTRDTCRVPPAPNAVPAPPGGTEEGWARACHRERPRSGTHPPPTVALGPAQPVPPLQEPRDRRTRPLTPRHPFTSSPQTTQPRRGVAWRHTRAPGPDPPQASGWSPAPCHALGWPYFSRKETHPLTQLDICP